jgi:hypothetical protein
MKTSSRNLLIAGYTIGIVGLGLAIFHRQITKNPDDMVLKNVGLGVFIVGAIFRIAGNRKKKQENPML